MELSPKKLDEKKIAELFLDLYNDKMKTSFKIIELSEHPDIICQDINSGEKLELEISLLEDIHGQIPYFLGRANQPISSLTKTAGYTFQDIIVTISSSLQNKLQCSYGENTALVYYQVTGLLETRNWEHLQIIFKDILNGKEKNYGAGIWIICTDAGFPAKYVLFCLCNPPI